MNAIDTNILIYAHDPRDAEKQRTAQELIRDLEAGVLLWQVACEFLSAARKLKQMGFDSNAAGGVVTDLRTVWRTLLPRWGVLDRSAALRAGFSLSFWDSLIVACCLDGGVRRLYSENITGYPEIENLEIVNPFDRKPKFLNP